MKRALWWVCALSISCAGDVSLELDRAELDEAADEMRRRMNVRLTRGSGATAEEQELSVDELVTQLSTWCDSQRPQGCIDSGYDGSNLCQYYECLGERFECISNELLNLAGDEPATVQLGTSLEEWTVPPQSVATKAALAAAAAKRARDAISYVDVSLYYMGLIPTYQDCGSNPTHIPAEGARPAMLRQEGAATLYRALLEVLEEATELTHRWTLSVADAQHSDQASIDEAARLSLLLPVGSRSDAAHRWVGGDEGLPVLQEISEGGFCPDPRMSPEARKAQELIRLSGANPRLLLDTSITLDAWLTSELLPRLADVLDAAHLTGITPQEFFEGFGISRQAFADAREYIGSEIRAFGRDLDAKLEDIPGVTAFAGDYYAATATTPPPPLQSYWASVASHSAVADPSSTMPTPLADLSADGLAGSLDFVVTRTRQMATYPNLDTISQDVLLELQGHHGGRRGARLQICMGGQGDPRTYVHYLSDNVETGLRVVVGHAGLQCAVRGTVEGAPCDMSNYLSEQTFVQTSAGLSFGYAWDYVADLDEGIEHERVKNILGLDRPENVRSLYGNDSTHVVPFYIVRERSAAGPGGFEEVGGVMFAVPKSMVEEGENADEYVCRTLTIVPEMDARAQEAVAPSSTYCAMSAQTCAGVPIDQRLPLENELINDGDAFETSWRHYLNLAREAADHADRLGEDLIRAGLEMDVRAEQAIDELEELCGVSLNVTELGAAVPPGTDPVEHAMTLLDDGDQLRLAACLGGGSTVDWVTLGHKALCFSWDGSSSDAFCGDGAGGRVADCPRSTDEPACLTGEERAEPLAFFTLSPEGEASLSEEEVGLPPCAELAALRGGVPTEKTSEQLVRTILAHPLFAERARTQRAAEQLGWVAYPGDYSAVTVSDGSWLSTGNYLVDASMAADLAWPCDAPQNAANRCAAPGAFDPSGNQA
ncbi:MAG: hypothetical protein AAGE52_38305, partial [Myxococcota bacterium]